MERIIWSLMITGLGGVVAYKAPEAFWGGVGLSLLGVLMLVFKGFGDVIVGLLKGIGSAFGGK